MNLDLVLTGVTVVDGTGASPFRADVGVSGARIAALGDLGSASAASRLEAPGMVVSPGFVDAHAHVEVPLLIDGAVSPKLAQGVTTEILGQDGLSYAPLEDHRLLEQVDYLSGLNGGYPGHGRTFADFLAQYEGSIAQNVASLAPYGAIRIAATGWVNRGLTDAEIQECQRLAAACIEQGAVGIGLGLDYFPQSVATTAELEAMGRVAAEHESVLVAHTRSRELGIVASVQELVDIAHRTGASVHVSHLRADAALPVIDTALADGVDITFDVYPYTVASSMLTMHLPAWVLDGGPEATRRRLDDRSARARLAPDLERRLGPALDEYVLSNVGRGQFAELVGGSLGAAVKAIGGDLVDALTRLLLANDLQVGYVGSTMTPASVAACVSHPAAMGCSDAILVGQRPHPRGWGAFPRFFREHVRGSGSLTLQECVHKLTGKTAARFGLSGRGKVAVGRAADLVLFDPEQIADRATFEDPTAAPTGIHAALVNGEIVWTAGVPTGRRPGSVILAT